MIAAEADGDCNGGVAGNSFEFSLMATTMPVVDESVFRGLLKAEDDPALTSVLVEGTCETA